ncbi:MAG TPA: hypothetical protein VHN37_03720 [Actinomycetota bacterium]|nr:hypothetical protein [Actinomycetota bacterium]
MFSLIAGLVAGIVLISNSTQEVVTEDFLGGFDVEEETNPFIVVLGVLAFLQGLLVWAVLHVLASMGENIALIASHTGRSSSDEVVDTPDSSSPEEQPSAQPDERDGWGGTP